MTTENGLMALPPEFPGLDQISTGAIYLMGCGSFKQYCCTLRSLADTARFCPFCHTELARRGRVPLRTMGGWLLFENEFKNDRSPEMLLIVPEKHMTAPSQLRSMDWVSLGALLDMCGIESGAVVMRFGNPRYHAGTIEHLHLNVIRPIPGTELRIPLAKDMADHTSNYQRLLKHQAELDAKGGKAWLFSEEGIKETQPALV